MKKISLILTAFMFLGSTSQAVEVKAPSQFVVEVKGIVCSFCAYGAKKNLSRVDFLDRSKFNKGLLMETEKGAITAAIAPGKKIDIAKIYKAIKKGGYEILSIHFNLVGTLKKRDDAVTLTHEYNGQEFTLVDEAGKSWDPKDYLGKEVSVQAMIPEPGITKGAFSKAISVQVKSIKESIRSSKP